MALITLCNDSKHYSDLPELTISRSNIFSVKLGSQITCKFFECEQVMRIFLRIEIDL